MRRACNWPSHKALTDAALHQFPLEGPYEAASKYYAGGKGDVRGRERELRIK